MKRARKAAEDAEDVLGEAILLLDRVKTISAKAQATLVQVDEDISIIHSIDNRLGRIENKANETNKWKHFSDNIKDVVKDTHIYEYGIYRNGGFRKLSVTFWGKGYRVMTEPYMTGFKDVFRLGGSMWFWDTDDRRDDKGVYHLYYYFDSDGVATKIGKKESGNKGNGAERGGEGKIYRREIK